MTDLSELPAAAGIDLRPDGDAAVSIRFDKLTHSYPGSRDKRPALADIDFEIRRGEVFGIIGRSGAGKSTLVRTINLLERPSGGRVLVEGMDLSRYDEKALAAARRRIGMIFQHFNLMDAKTVAENIALPLRIAGVPKAVMAEKVKTLLDTVGLAEKHDVYPSQLSGGQKQRVGIARALVHGPDILLCDEATSALDPESTESILALLRDINRKLGLTVVLITHEMEVVRQACDRVAVLEQGRVVELGEVWQVFGAPQAEATKALLRAVVHELPHDLRARVSDVRESDADALLVEVQVDGSLQQEPDLAALIASFGRREVRLVHGGVERIQGRTQGRLVLALNEPEERGDWAAGLGLSVHRVRKLGYLRSGSHHA